MLSGYFHVIFIQSLCNPTKKMENGKWKMEIGKWKMEKDLEKTKHGKGLGKGYGKECGKGLGKGYGKGLEMYVKGSTAVLQHCNVTENNVLCYPT